MTNDLHADVRVLVTVVSYRSATNCHLPTLHSTCYRIDTWAIRRPWLTFVNTLAISILGRFHTARTQRFASWVWPMVLRKLVNRWKWKGEAWFHYTKVLFAGAVGIAEMWFYLVESEKKQPAEKIVENCWAMRSWKPRPIDKLHSSSDFNRIWTAATGQEMGVSFYIAKPLRWFQSRSLTSLFSTVQQKTSVKYEDSQHFVGLSRNLRTVGRLLQFTKLQL